MKIKQVPFRAYNREAVKKTQVYLHHTAGNGSGEQTFAYWEKVANKVATCVAISTDGTIVQGFGSEYWAYHLGLGTKHFMGHGCPYLPLDKTSIGIEVCNWGPITKKGTKFYNYVGGEIPADQVTELPTAYKGYKLWHKYTDEQIQSVKDLLILWNEKYGIDLTYNEDIWVVTKRALKNESGVFTHNSVRADKADVYPCPRLIEMLKSLTKEK
jgi:N-acetyl-anhydromuramyl-L-alanine amidase AmpD